MIKLVADNEKPKKPKRVRFAPNVSRYCPSCGSNTWITVNVGPADILTGIKPVRMKCCVFCLSRGQVVTW